MNKSFTLTFTTQDLDILSKSLVELPFKIAAPIIDNINKQIQEQLAAESDAKDAPTR